MHISIQNLETTTVIFVDYGDRTTSVFPGQEISLPFINQQLLKIYWKNGYNDNNYMINQIQCIPGYFCVYTSEYIRIPKIRFEPHLRLNEFDPPVEEQAIGVGKELLKLMSCECYNNNCSCMQNIEEMLNILITKGFVTSYQLDSILNSTKHGVFAIGKIGKLRASETSYMHFIPADLFPSIVSFLLNNEIPYAYFMKLTKN